MIKSQFKKIYVLHNLNLPTSAVSSLFLRLHKPKVVCRPTWNIVTPERKQQCEAHVSSCGLRCKIYVNEKLYIIILGKYHFPICNIFGA